MFSPLRKTYPSGFTQLLSSPQGVLDLSPDAEIVELYNEMYKGSGVLHWPFVRRVLAAAHRLFDGNLRVWLREQESNTRLSDNARGFLNDTVTFINTGVRPVSIGARMRILVREQSFTSVDPGAQAIQTIVDLTANPLSQWMRQEDGIVDLVLTLNVIFGKALTPQ